MIKKSMKKNLAIFVAMVLVFSSFGTSFAANFGDLNKAPWASETIQKWSDYGFVSGYGDSTFRPLADVTRAEFAVMAYNAFSLESKFGLNFSDVKSGDWFYDQVVKMSKLGYIKGYADGTFKPNAPIKRSEAVAMIANILGLTANEEAAKVFADYEAIPSWVRGQVGASAMAKFVSGYTDGTFKAEDTINRAESVAMLNNAVYGANQFANSWRIVEAGTYGGTTEKPTVIEGNVVIKTPDVELKNVEIKGNLTIGVEVGEGDVDLTNVVVAGDTNVYGGGANSVKINGGSYGKVFIMKQADTPVRLLTVNVKGIDVVVPAASGAKNIILEGIFNSVQLLAAGTEVKTQGNTTISEISVAPTAVETVITTSEGTVIAKAIINVNLKVLGQGRIVVAEVTVENVSFEKQPETVNDEPTTTTPPATGGSTGGGTVTPPATDNYQLWIEKNGDSDTDWNLKTFSGMVTTTKISFDHLEAVYDEYATLTSIQKGFNTIRDILMLENASGKKYAESFADRLNATDASNLNELAVLKTGTLVTDLLDGATDVEINAIADALLDPSFSVRGILVDLKELYGSKAIPNDKVKVEVFNGSSLTPITDLTTSNIEKEISDILGQVSFAQAKGHTVLKVTLNGTNYIEFFVK